MDNFLESCDVLSTVREKGEKNQQTRKKKKEGKEEI